MDVKYINPFLEGTIEVLKTMAFVNPRPGKPYLKKNNLAKGDVSGIIGITGTIKGSLALSFTTGSILKIVSNMLGEEITSLNGEIRDAVGEITNMVSGAARKKIEAMGYSLSASLPTVVSGMGHTIMHVLGGPSIVIPFEMDEGSFVVDISMGDPQ
ncbi:MAG: chemotaxis protein CheX [Syntrophales bacterium]|jgi:chemotaxis protein CheX